MSAAAVKYNEIKESGAEVIAISTNSHFSHKIWDEVELSKMVDGGIPYPMVADTAVDILPACSYCYERGFLKETYEVVC